jgi:hypothetical protein
MSRITHSGVRCAQCNKTMKAYDVEVLFYKPNDRPFGLHKGCEKDYEAHKGEKIDGQETA